MSRSYSRGCGAVLFVCGCTPYPSLRESVCCHAAAVQDRQVLTPSILVRPSRERRAASIRVTPTETAGPQGSSGWPCAARASSSRKKGRCNRLALVLPSSCYTWFAWRNGVGLCWRATRQGIAKSRARQGRAAASACELRQLFLFSPLERLGHASENASRFGGKQPQSGATSFTGVRPGR